MTDKSYNSQLSEKFIINKFLKKLNLDTAGTFNFENDAAYLNSSKKNKIVVTTDTIVENIDLPVLDIPSMKILFLAMEIDCLELKIFMIFYKCFLTLPMNLYSIAED